MKRFLLLINCLFIFATAQAEIKAVAFDFGGVMVNHDRQPVYHVLHTHLGIPMKELRNAQKLGDWSRLMEGKISEEAFWQEVAARSHSQQRDHFACAYKIGYAAGLRPIAGMQELVKNLQEAGYQTPLLSNIYPWPAEVNEVIGYYDPFKPVVLSCEVGMKKPDLKIYQYLLDLLELSPDEVVFIDDREDNIAAARLLGIHGIHFEGIEELREQLAQMGVTSVGDSQEPVSS